MNVPANNKFLYFANAVDDVLCMPLSNLISIDHTAGDTVEFAFEDELNGNAVVQCTTASNAEKEFIQQVINEINFGNDAMIVVADDDHSVYLSSNVTAVASLVRAVGPRRKVETITTATNNLTDGQSGTLFVLNDTGDACTITLPEITAANIGVTYEFILQGENADGYTIKTGDANDTTGDIFIGGLAYLHPDADQTAQLFVQAADNDAQIVLDSNLANGGGEIGTQIVCTAVAFDGTAHSHWAISGIVATHLSGGTGAAVLADQS